MTRSSHPTRETTLRGLDQAFLPEARQPHALFMQSIAEMVWTQRRILPLVCRLGTSRFSVLQSQLTQLGLGTAETLPILGSLQRRDFAFLTEFCSSNQDHNSSRSVSISITKYSTGSKEDSCSRHTLSLGTTNSQSDALFS